MKNAKCHLEKTSSLSTAPWPQQTLPSSKPEILSATSRFKWAKAQISRGLEIKKKTKHIFLCMRNRATLRAGNCRNCSPSALCTLSENLSKCAATVKGVQRRLAVGQGPDSLLTQTSFAAKGGPIKY